MTCAQAVLEAAARPLINHRDREFAQMLARIDAALRPAFGTSGEVMLLGSSGTGALEAAVANFFSPGERLLSCPVGSFGRRFAEIASTFGCIVESLETPPGAAVDPTALSARLEADTGREIAGVLLTHNETSTGVACDMAALAPSLRAHGALSLVDSISGLGASEFRMDEWGYDVVVSASQKGFAAPPGVAMLAASDRAWKRAQSARLPRYYFDLSRARKSAALGQTPWTPPISIVYALDVALQRYHAEGASVVQARIARFAEAVRTALERLRFTIFSQPGAHSPTVVAAYPPAGVDARELLERLRVRHGVVLAGGLADMAGKIVRFGTMGDVCEVDLVGAVAAIELELASRGGAPAFGTGSAAALEVLAERVTSGVA